MGTHGFLIAGGHTYPALLPNSRLLQNPSNSRNKNLPHSFEWTSLKSISLGLSLPQRCSSNRPVCRYAPVYQGGAGSSERGGKQRIEEVAEIVEGHDEMSVPRRTVAVFWDLDNKPPNQVPAYDAALRLKKLAGEFGEVVDMVAYANRNAFTYVPSWIREERQDRKVLDQLEKNGVVKVESPYICSMCGRKMRTNVDLKKHFKQLHERERNKRLAYLGQLKGKKRTKFLEKVAPKEFKYKEVARKVLVPKVGYGLASELKRAGVAVRTVEKKPQAADEALLRHMNLYIHKGIEVMFLVSDDSDFLGILKLARNKRVWTIVIGNTVTLRGAADSSFSWDDVATGRALLNAHEKVQRWANEDALRVELHDEDCEFADDSEDSEEEFLEYQRNLRSSLELSPFADDEDGYHSDDKDDEDEEGEGKDKYTDDELFSGGWDREEEGEASRRGFN